MKTNFIKLILVIVFLVASRDTINAQTPNWLWAKAMGGISNDAGAAILVDNAGNVFTLGYFSGMADFDPDPIRIFNLTSAGNYDIFISKSDNVGNFVWAKRIGGGNAEYGTSLAIDVYGNIYATGNFIGTADFDPGPGTFYLTSAGSIDIFTFKLDSSGNFIWALQMGGISDDASNSIALDSFGNLYTTGYFIGMADFDPDSTGIFNLTSTGGAPNIFVSKIDTAGNFVWAKQMGGNITAVGFSITIDCLGNVYTTGEFYSAADFDPDSSRIFNLASAGETDIFISKLDNSGNFLWAKRMGGPDDNVAYSIAIDLLCNVYVSGNFYGTANFDPDSSGGFDLTASGSSDFYIAKLDSSGKFLWAKAMGGTDYDVSVSIQVDSAGSVYSTGCFSGTVDFDPSVSGYFSLTALGVYRDIFVSKLDSSGNLVWAKAMGGTAHSGGSSITIDTSGNVYVTGNFNSPSIALGADTLINVDVGSNTSDIFIAKLAINSWQTFTLNPLLADYATCFVLDSCVYLGTGQDSSGNYLTNMYKFDPSGPNIWNNIADYSRTARARSTGFSLNGKGYIGLGFDGNVFNDFLEYYPPIDSWSATSHALNYNNGGAPSRYYAVTFTIGNIAYVGLGTNGSSVFNDFYSFDGTNWTQIADFPGGQRYAAVAFTIGETAYVGTGIDNNGITHQDFYAYDHMNGWNANPINLGIGNERANAVAFSIGRYGFVVSGGQGNGTNCTNDLWQYDPLNNTFRQRTSLPSTSLYNFSVGFAIGGKGYVCFGGNCDGTHPTNEVWEYTPDNEVIASWIGINKINKEYRRSILFPNPVIDHATIIVRLNSIKIDLSNIKFSAINLLGKSVHMENKIFKTSDGNIIINIERGKLCSGFFVYEIRNGIELLGTGKFIVQ